MSFLWDVFKNFVAAFLPSSDMLGALLASWGFLAVFAGNQCWKKHKQAKASGSGTKKVTFDIVMVVVGIIGLIPLIIGSVGLYRSHYRADNISSNSSPAVPVSASDPNSIYQAGIAVGQVFGARRSPQDATLFTFVEITRANQFNSAAEFDYLTQTLKLKSVERRTGFDGSRPQDGMIYGNVTAKIVPKIPTAEMKAQKVQAARRWLKLADEMAATPRFAPLSNLPVSSDKWMQLSQDEKDRLWNSAMNQEQQKDGNEQQLFEQRFAQRLEQARTEMVQYGVDTEYVFETPATNDLKTRMALRMRSPELPVRIGAAARKLLASEGENAEQ